MSIIGRFHCLVDPSKKFKLCTSTVLRTQIDSLLPVNQDLVEAGIDKVRHQHAVVTANSLNPLAVHLVVGVGFGEEETSIPLLVNQQVGEVHLQVIVQQKVALCIASF